MVAWLGLLLIGVPASAQPGVRDDDEPPARQVPISPNIAPVAPSVPMLLLRADGQVLIANWLTIKDDAIHATEAGTNRAVRAPLGDVLAILSASPGANPSLGIGGIASAWVRPLVPSGRVLSRASGAEAGMLRAVDGMILPGTIKPSAGNDETVRWNEPRLGPWSIPLDRVAWIWFDRVGTEWLGFSAPDAGTPSEDLVALANGDRIRGFVLDVGSTLDMERMDGTSLSLPMDRVAGLWLANPEARPSGAWAFTDLGNAIPMGRVEGTSDEHWLGTHTNDAGERVLIQHAELAALILSAERLRPLATIAPDSVVSMHSAAGEALAGELLRRVRHPLEVGTPIGSPFGIDDLLLTRVMEARWTLPPGTERLVATARLPDPRNPWSSAVLIVEVDGREIHRSALTPEQPAAALNLAASGGALTIRVEQGQFGPVQNAVLLHRPMLILAGE